MGRSPSYPSQTGFSYAMVLAAVVIVGIVVEAAHVTTWRILRADREAELLFRGQAYRNAIASFYQSNGAFPRSLEDLPKDPRSAGRKHIRALYPDPMGRGEKAGVEAHSSRGWRYFGRSQREHGKNRSSRRIFRRSLKSSPARSRIPNGSSSTSSAAPTDTAPGGETAGREPAPCSGLPESLVR